MIKFSFSKPVAAILLFVCLMGVAVALSGHASRADDGGFPHLNADELEARILQKDMLPLLVQFDASWCPYCRALQPRLQSLYDRRAGTIEIVRVNSDTEGELLQGFEVKTLPTLMIFMNGELIDRYDGSPQEDELFEWVDRTTGVQ